MSNHEPVAGTPHPVTRSRESLESRVEGRRSTLGDLGCGIPSHPRAPSFCRQDACHPHPSTGTTLTLGLVLATWWPLAASWLLMGIEMPLVTAVMGRLPDETVQLAAYGGVFFPISLAIEAPVIMLLRRQHPAVRLTGELSIPPTILAKTRARADRSPRSDRVHAPLRPDRRSAAGHAGSRRRTCPPRLPVHAAVHHRGGGTAIPPGRAHQIRPAAEGRGWGRSSDSWRS